MKKKQQPPKFADEAEISLKKSQNFVVSKSDFRFC